MSFYTVSVQIFNIRSFVCGISSVDGIACMTLVDLLFLVVGGDLYAAGTYHALFGV